MLRHATAALMTPAAAHRLLILLSDGRPNDVDRYDGRYGVEDLRQAITEARLHAIAPFCLTLGGQAAHYLPAVFGAHGYALLPRAELLPRALLQWLQRLVARWDGWATSRSQEVPMKAQRRRIRQAGACHRAA